MNDIIQNILVITTAFLAVVFLVKKYLPKKSKPQKGCGTGTDCSCH
ncbi:FeoB-associated Cys-rich membrane protein [Seonamhaeicola marinus]|uniref:FeoB-associated Cys-rich membrane protein n=1 Tax=Seonamhaeicola marinus TaxID=1912246 RepID=A0A5D0HRK7_9FLAO|nr:FeoB-associated Cys-rich membrane protein [Seonamhaeicola marinus]TYA73976.1 FeoB-associated Cys-rich membrane protein [Seonamhaeicola marinus]